jgi:hypothetical protein
MTVRSVGRYKRRASAGVVEERAGGNWLASTRHRFEVGTLVRLLVRYCRQLDPRGEGSAVIGRMPRRHDSGAAWLTC